MKRLKKCLALLIASIMLVAMSSTAYARWDYLVLISGTIDIDSSNRAHVEVMCTSDATEVDSLTVKCELQQLDGSWKTIKTWTESSNGPDLGYEKDYAVYKGYSYRLKITAKAYQGSRQVESVTEYFDYRYYN